MDKQHLTAAKGEAAAEAVRVVELAQQHHPGGGSGGQGCPGKCRLEALGPQQELVVLQLLNQGGARALGTLHFGHLLIGGLHDTGPHEHHGHETKHAQPGAILPGPVRLFQMMHHACHSPANASM